MKIGYGITEESYLDAYTIEKAPIGEVLKAMKTVILIEFSHIENLEKKVSKIESILSNESIDIEN